MNNCANYSSGCDDRWNFDSGRPASHFDTFFVALLTVFQVNFVLLRRKNVCVFLCFLAYIKRV